MVVLAMILFLQLINEGVEKVRIFTEGNSWFNGGNIGIGTTSPQQKLHIVDTDGANIILNSNTGAENNGVWMTEGGIVNSLCKWRLCSL